MKWFATMLASLAVIGAARAQQVNSFPLNQAFGTISTNYAFTAFTNANPSNVVSFTVEPALYHTLQFYTTTSNFSYVIDRTLDNTNWYYGATNAVTSSAVAEATITGKYKLFRVRIQGTNITGGINYLGGR